MSYYAVRDTAKAGNRPWRGAWIATRDRTEVNGVVVTVFGLSVGNLDVCDRFWSLETAQSLVMYLAVVKPEYIGRLAIHPVEWSTSGHKLLVGRQVE